MQKTQVQKQAQTDRNIRANSAILAGRFQVRRINPGIWTVRNGDQLPYVVSLNSIQGNEPETIWTCTCQDYQNHGPEVLCKHIEGIKLLETAHSQVSQTIEKEIHMDETRTSAKGETEDSISEIYQRLKMPLDFAQLKHRKAPGNTSIPYLDGSDVIDKANDIFGFAWSFDLLSEPKIIRWQKKILVWNDQEKCKLPALDANGVVQTEDVGVVSVSGKISVEINGKAVQHADLGCCAFAGDTPEALVMSITHAASECLKRCFRQLGEQFGSQLYDKDISPSFCPQQKQPTPETMSAPIPNERLYGDGDHVNGNHSEQQAFDQYKEKTGTCPASRESLRNWLVNQRANEKTTSFAV